MKRISLDGLGIGFGLGLVLLSKTVFASPATDAPPQLIIQDSPLRAEVKAATSFAPVIKKVTPSVVNIYSTMTIHETRTRGPFSDNPLLRRFFGDEFGGQTESRDHKAQSLGSGVIVSANGYILTANHVVEGADKVKVALVAGEKEFEARVIGADPPTDIAVLKIDEKRELPAATLGDSDKLEVGDVVLAIGNPFGLSKTVTMGIVSALGRGGFGINDYENFIQTDAAINQGNSGGALVDAEGRVVGINTAILSRSGGFQGVGLAVPINMARYVMDRITTEGKVARGFLGIYMQPLTPELAKELHLADESSGVLVGGVSPNSAAEKAGVKDGDLVMEFNGKKVTDPSTFRLLVAQSSPGTKVNLRVLRSEENGKPTEKTLTARLAPLPPDMLAGNERGPANDRGQPVSDGLDGVQVTALDAQTRRQFEIPREVNGALIASVDPDSNSAEAGLRAGDVIVAINRQAVRGPEDAVAMSEKVKGGHILLRVWSPGGGVAGTRYVVVDNTRKDRR
jgi:serine protease Do